MPRSGPEQDLVLAGGEHGVDQRSSSSTERAMMPGGPRVREGGELGLLDDAPAGGEQHEAARRRSPAPRRRPRSSRPPGSCTRFTIALPLPCGPDVGDLVDLQPVDPAAVGEDQDVGVGGGDEEVGDEVLVLGLHPHAAAPAALLRAVARDRGALDVAGVGDRDRHVLVGDQVLDARSRSAASDDLGAARVRRGSSRSCRELLDDDLRRCGLGEARMSLRSAIAHRELGELVHDLLALEAGQPLQLQLEDLVGLDLA